MGTLSLSKTGRLFWLGRYTERVYTVLRLTRPIREAEIDGQEADYTEYCRCMGIPAGYADTADFCRRYFFDAEDPASVAASLGFAYDNAVVLRETLSSDTLAYIQLAMNAMELTPPRSTTTGRCGRPTLSAYIPRRPTASTRKAPGRRYRRCCAFSAG